jgi:formylglycine-generating enzyme required for sulfatase activity
MKTKIFSLLTAVPAALLLLSFVAPKPKEVLDLKTIDNSMAKVNDKLYACKYEVTNFLYRNFENDLKLNKRTNDLKTACVDTLNWRDNKCYNEPFVEYYYRHLAYDNYPVVNISYDAANLFCKWLTEKYNANPKRKFKKVIFRLPNEKEWEFAAAGGENNYFPYP